MSNHFKNELHNVISGKSQVSYGTIIQAITSYLDNGSRTSNEIENSKQIQEQEKKKLEDYITKCNLWIDDIDFSQYVSEGAEQRVYLKDSDHVLKLNDAINYQFWTDYFYNLLLRQAFVSV